MAELSKKIRYKSSLNPYKPITWLGMLADPEKNEALAKALREAAERWSRAGSDQVHEMVAKINERNAQFLASLREPLQNETVIDGERFDQIAQEIIDGAPSKQAASEGLIMLGRRHAALNNKK
jgi:hypothetical protein